MSRYDVRAPREGDAEAIAAVHVACWRESYARVMPAVVLDGLDVAERTERWRERITAPQERHPSLVATADGEIVGFASVGPSRDDPPDPPVELYAMYLLAAHQGSGLAQRLITAVLGDQRASLWVLADNPRAQAFYSRNGFRPDGQTSSHQPTGAAVIRMVRSPRWPEYPGGNGAGSVAECPSRCV